MSQKINEKLGAWLLVEGNTQDNLADQLGITRPTLRRRLQGTSDWTWNEVVKIATITGSTLNELAGIPDAAIA